MWIVAPWVEGFRGETLHQKQLEDTHDYSTNRCGCISSSLHNLCEPKYETTGLIAWTRKFQYSIMLSSWECTYWQLFCRFTVVKSHRWGRKNVQFGKEKSSRKLRVAARSCAGKEARSILHHKISTSQWRLGAECGLNEKCPPIDSRV